MVIMEFLWVDGFDYGVEVEKIGIDFYVVKMFVEYVVFVCFDENVDVGVWIDCVGNLSLMFVFGVFGYEESDLCVIGEVIWVYID